MKKPLVSIIMSVYNEKEKWLRESIESILNQTYRNIEFIIIIDNPNQQKLIQVIDEYSMIDERIKYYVNEQNFGLVYSLNKAINLCKGEFIARMDADDIAFLNRIELQIKYLLENKDVSLIGSQMLLIDEMGNLINKKIKFPCELKKISMLLRYTNVFCHPSLMFKLDFIKKMNGYRDIKYAEDYDLICRSIISGYKIMNLPDPLIKYRIRMNSITRQHNDIQMQSDLYIKNYYRKLVLTSDLIYENRKKITLYEKIITKKNMLIFKCLNYFMNDF